MRWTFPSPEMMFLGTAGDLSIENDIQPEKYALKARSANLKKYFIKHNKKSFRKLCV